MEINNKAGMNADVSHAMDEQLDSVSSVEQFSPKGTLHTQIQVNDSRSRQKNINSNLTLRPRLKKNLITFRNPKQL